MNWSPIYERTAFEHGFASLACVDCGRIVHPDTECPCNTGQDES